MLEIARSNSEAAVCCSSVLRGLREYRGSFRWWRFHCRITTQQRYGVEQLSAMTNRPDAEVLQVLCS
jgi:hypothetical protein